MPFPTCEAIIQYGPRRGEVCGKECGLSKTCSNHFRCCKIQKLETYECQHVFDSGVNEGKQCKTLTKNKEQLCYEHCKETRDRIKQYKSSEEYKKR